MAGPVSRQRQVSMAAEGGGAARRVEVSGAQ